MRQEQVDYYSINLQTSTKERTIEIVKRGIWLYLFLLLFEGALRKWFLPGLATPLLVVRDPIAVWLIYMCWKNRLLQMNNYIVIVAIVTIISFFLSILVGHGHIIIAIYGARIYLLHFPLIFIIGKLMTREDVIKIGRVILYLSIPMIIIVTLQFISPQSAWINRGVGGDLAGAGFSGALGYSRPPGLFSFATGNVMFWGIVGAFVVYFWIVPGKIKHWLLIAASGALILSIPLSISRSAFFQVLLTLLFSGFYLLRKPKLFWRFLLTFILLSICIFVLSQTSLFNISTEAFLTRFNAANEAEGGLEGVFLDRFLGGMINALTNSQDLPFWGYGLGLGTNVASAILSGGGVFLISEGEWGRVIGEMGFLLGIIIILVRFSLVVRISLASFSKMREGDLLPWILLSFGLLILLQGQWAQPTALGFSTFVGGMILASLKKDEVLDN